MKEFPRKPDNSQVARARQATEHGTALIEELRYTIALSRRLIEASHSLLKRSQSQGGRLESDGIEIG
ncbi:hypothetical protein NKI19_20280 [Mesorhizobium sp. M0751]|uniref:hypothetical protein n=1 Tax=unclassified Mesorhizobium TaxID=325217 RepID=UPI003335CD1B